MGRKTLTNSIDVYPNCLKLIVWAVYVCNASEDMEYECQVVIMICHREPKKPLFIVAIASMTLSLPFTQFCTSQAIPPMASAL